MVPDPVIVFEFTFSAVPSVVKLTLVTPDTGRVAKVRSPRIT